jgi:methionyl-tRNA formyltransferase
VLAAATLGGVNVHTSLLPRHRGPLPLFWIYHGNDREAGVTVHRMIDDYDAGEIITQHAFSLERGYPVDALHQRHVEVAPGVLRAAVRALADGTARPRPQDESLATAAPFVRPGDRMVNFDAWDVERVWHFLAGLFPRFIEPLADAEGRPLTYGGVTGFEPGEPRSRPGTATRTASDRLALHCRDGVVFLRQSRT